MPGRKKESVEAILDKGNKPGLTKEEIEQRCAEEARARGPSDRVNPPSYLTAKQKKEFMEIANELMRIDLISNLDVDTLAQYIDARSHYREVLKAIKKFKPTSLRTDEETGLEYLCASKEYASLQRTKDLLFKQCRSIAGELGLTFSSRLKLRGPQKNDDDQDNSKFGKWAGKR